MCDSGHSHYYDAITDHISYPCPHLGVVDSLHGFEELTEITGYGCGVFLKHTEQRASLENTSTAQTGLQCVITIRESAVY